MSFTYKSNGKDVGDWSKVPSENYSVRAKTGILSKYEAETYEAPKPVKGNKAK
ncbi:MAG: hypothetical protein VW496_03995 [Pelagibacteraceae bacterium]|jgi:hypothetical protein